MYIDTLPENLKLEAQSLAEAGGFYNSREDIETAASVIADYVNSELTIQELHKILRGAYLKMRVDEANDKK